LAVGLNAVLETVKLPAGVAHLDSGLSNVDRDALTLENEKKQKLGISNAPLTLKCRKCGNWDRGTPQAGILRGKPAPMHDSWNQLEFQIQNSRPKFVGRSRFMDQSNALN